MLTKWFHKGRGNYCPVGINELMNELMFNDTPTQSLHRLLGVKQKVFMQNLKNNNILNNNIR